MTVPIAAGSAKRFLHAVIRWSGPATDLSGANLFLHGAPDALRQLRWAHWRPTDAAGKMITDGDFCPGFQETLDQMYSRDGHRSRDWGGFRSSRDLFGDLRDNFVLFPEMLTSRMQALSPSSEAFARMVGVDASVAPRDNYFLLSMKLPDRGDTASLMQGVSLSFGCCIVTNRSELTVFKHTAGNRVVDIELPESLGNILGITEVIDSQKREYLPRHDVQHEAVELAYTIEERSDRLVLWFDFSSRLAMPPDAITVRYAVTEGPAANGIEPGKIADLYVSHPGLVSCRNTTTVRGGIPAKTSEQILTEVSARLRGRDRALTFADIRAWARTFDPRIIDVECEHGVQKSLQGVRRCVVVGVHVNGADFYSDEEMDLLRERLRSFLKARATINSQFEVEMIRR